MLHEFARVLRYPRLQAFYSLTENLVFDYVSFLRQSAEIVTLHALVVAPVRDVNDIIVMQTAIIGDAHVLCTKDQDFFESPAREYLDKLGIAVLDDIGLCAVCAADNAVTNPRNWSGTYLPQIRANYSGMVGRGGAHELRLSRTRRHPLRRRRPCSLPR